MDLSFIEISKKNSQPVLNKVYENCSALALALSTLYANRLLIQYKNTSGMAAGLAKKIPAGYASDFASCCCFPKNFIF